MIQDLTGTKIDLIKFILAILVVMLHILDYGVLAPLFRCAVPLFFTISAYLFFNKLKTKETPAERDAYMFKTEEFATVFVLVYIVTSCNISVTGLFR